MDLPNVPVQPADTSYAAFAAIDWADKKHDWALQVAGSGKIERGVVENTPEAVDVWAAELARRFEGRPIAVALEQSRGAVVWMLTKYAHLILHPVHPAMLSSYRKSFYPSGAKSDQLDTDLLLDLLTRHPDRLKPLRPDTVETRTLQMLVEERRKLVDDKTRDSNRLTGWLKQFFPQILDWFDNPCAPIAMDFLKRWPTLPELQKARPETVRKFFRQHNSRGTERIEIRIEQIRVAEPATRDEAVLEVGVLMAANLIGIVATMCKAIDGLETRIGELMKVHPDAAVIESFPGAGPAMAPRLIAALGTNRDRFATAVELQCYSGIAPVIASSGNRKYVHWRWACSGFVRQTFHEWAGHSMKSSQWAREFYAQQRAKGKSRHAAIRSLAFKWERILFRCWKDRVPYDEAKYEASLHRNTPKLAANAAG